MKKLLITVPCYNEEIVLEKTIFSLFQYATKNLSTFDWKIFILDNNSKDKTWDIAKTLKAKYGDKIVIDQVPTPGRGVALREAWLKMLNFDIYAYTDADLSTDIKDFSFIINKVSDGNDLVTGSRYLANSDVKRDFFRKGLSKIYNLLLKLVLNVNFKDAQCGFKAFSNKLVSELFPKTSDNGWFWDTELMILACRGGYKVLEVPISWREARDELRKSTVAVFSEIFKNLKNILIMKKRLAKSK